MKLANIDVLVWLIIFVMVAVAKGWSKLQQPTDDNSSESDEAPPVVRPRPQVPRPRPQPQPRPAVAPVPRTARPPPRTVVPRTTARPVPPPTQGERKVDADQIRRFIEQMGGKAQPPSPPPVAPPFTREAEPTAPSPQPEPARDAPAATQTTVKTPAPAQASRASQWAEALRDRNNIRNIIIAAEIIGPPRAESA